MGFDEIVDGLELEPIEVAVLRETLKDTRHPFEHDIVDAVLDDLREVWGPGVFDKFCIENAAGPRDV